MVMFKTLEVKTMKYLMMMYGVFWIYVSYKAYCLSIIH